MPSLSTSVRPGTAASLTHQRRSSGASGGSATVIAVTYVPSDSSTVPGSTSPHPSASTALSLAVAWTGSPAGIPVAAEAAAVTCPSTSPGSTSSGDSSAGGSTPWWLATLSRRSPVSRVAR